MFTRVYGFIFLYSPSDQTFKQNYSIDMLDLTICIREIVMTTVMLSIVPDLYMYIFKTFFVVLTQNVNFLLLT